MVSTRPKRKPRKLNTEHDEKEHESGSDVKVTGKRRQREGDSSPKRSKKKQNTSTRQTPALRRSRKRSLTDDEPIKTTHPLPSSKRKKKANLTANAATISADTGGEVSTSQRIDATAAPAKTASSKKSKPTRLRKQKECKTSAAGPETSTSSELPAIREPSRAEPKPVSTQASAKKAQDGRSGVAGSSSEGVNSKKGQDEAKSQQIKSPVKAVQSVSRQHKLVGRDNLKSLRFHIHSIGILVVLLLLLQHPSIGSSSLQSRGNSCFSGEPCVFDRDRVQQMSLEIVLSTLDDLKQSLHDQSALIQKRRLALTAHKQLISTSVGEFDVVLDQQDEISLLAALKDSKVSGLRKLHDRVTNVEEEVPAPDLSESITTLFDQVIDIEDDLNEEHDPEYGAELREALGELAAKVNSGKSRVVGKSELADMVRDEVEKHFVEEKDIALLSGGAQVVARLTSVFPHETSVDPSTVLAPTSPVRNCFAFKGVYGNLTVRFPFHATLTAGEVQHGTIELSPLHSPLVAPKTVDVFGLELDRSNNVVSEELLGRLRRPATKFSKRLHIASTAQFNAVRFSFIENHGEKLYTCVHRVRVIAS